MRREQIQQLQAALRCNAGFDPGMICAALKTSQKIAHFLLDFVCKQSVSGG